jgi:hypothetical protein
MMGEIFGGLSAIKTALDIVQGLKNVSDVSARNRAVIELEEKLLAATKAQIALLNRISELEKQVADFEKWDAEADRYEKKKFGHGIAWFLKPEAQGSEPSHPVCANCFEKRKAVPLQEVPTNLARRRNTFRRDTLQRLGLGIQPGFDCG